MNSDPSANAVTQSRRGTSFHRAAAIEAPKGYFQSVGIGAGARVEFLFDVSALLKP